MPTLVHAVTSEATAPTPKPDPKALKILAKSIFKELKSQGYDQKQVVSLATELISLVTSELAHDSDSHR
jgi:hypothetical protein